jgi:hypothetical protein
VALQVDGLLGVRFNGPFCLAVLAWAAKLLRSPNFFGVRLRIGRNRQPRMLVLWEEMKSPLSIAF